MLVQNVIHGCVIPLLLADGKSPQLQMRAKNNKGGEFVKKTDNKVVVNGNNNHVEIKITEYPLKTPVAIVIAIATIMVVAVLAVSLCCPELLADFVRWIISVAVGS